MQSGLTNKLGKWMGLLLSNVSFTAWHYLSPIVDLAPFPLKSWVGLISTFIAGLVYGYAFQRTENIIAPWLAHSISGVLFIVFGAMDLIQVIK
jgi:membrane protease YdiL (CAAX protease family)